jgi:DNA polymerase-3 subunit delta'
MPKSAKSKAQPAATPGEPFAGILNQPLAKSILSASLATRHYPSFLFAGPAGVGKRTMALLFAQAINCTSGDQPQRHNNTTNQEPRTRNQINHQDTKNHEPGTEDGRPCGECWDCRHILTLAHPDVRLLMPLKPEGESDDEPRASRDRQKLVDEAMKRSTEFTLGKMRPLAETKWQIPIHLIHWVRSEMAYAPVRAKRRVIIVLDADQMNPISANAFLKTLEEPQKDTTFILVTERTHKLLDTIRSRCQTVRFAFLPVEEITRYLIDERKVGEKDARIAAEVAGGSLRQALDYLENPDDFLLPEALGFFALNQPTADDCRKLAEQADPNRIEGLIDSLTFLYNQALHLSLGLPACYAAQDQAVKARAQGLKPEHVRRKLEILLRAKREYEYNVNRKLFLFALLAMLAEPDRR